MQYRHRSVEFSRHRLLAIAAGLAWTPVPWIAGCNLVLGIDDVSSASAPDGGRRSEGVSSHPSDASAGGSDPLSDRAIDLAPAPLDAAYADASTAGDDPADAAVENAASAFDAAAREVDSSSDDDGGAAADPR
jgi:hypothetical protein